MSDFKAKMHQIRFPLMLCPRPRWGSLHSPKLLAVLRGLLLRGGRGRGRGGEWKEKGRVEAGEGRRGGKGGEGKGEEEREGTRAILLRKGKRGGKGIGGKSRDGRRGEGICQTNVNLLTTCLDIHVFYEPLFCIIDSTSAALLYGPCKNQWENHNLTQCRIVTPQNFIFKLCRRD